MRKKDLLAYSNPILYLIGIIMIPFGIGFGIGQTIYKASKGIKTLDKVLDEEI